MPSEEEALMILTLANRLASYFPFVAVPVDIVVPEVPARNPSSDKKNHC
jgi:hypothetical protein